jgi:hypothetical protein
MRIFFVAFFCFVQAFSHAQARVSRDVMADNASQVNADGTNRFETPIGLDLMGGNTKGVTIYPNPANDFLIISVAGKPSDKKRIAITALTGKNVFQTANRHENTFMIDMSSIPRGIYVIEVACGAQVYRKKWARP